MRSPRSIPGPRGLAPTRSAQLASLKPSFRSLVRTMSWSSGNAQSSSSMATPREPPSPSRGGSRSCGGPRAGRARTSVRSRCGGGGRNRSAGGAGHGHVDGLLGHGWERSQDGWGAECSRSRGRHGPEIGFRGEDSADPDRHETPSTAAIEADRTLRRRRLVRGPRRIIERAAWPRMLPGDRSPSIR